MIIIVSFKIKIVWSLTLSEKIILSNTFSVCHIVVWNVNNKQML